MKSIFKKIFSFRFESSFARAEKTLLATPIPKTTQKEKQAPYFIYLGPLF